MESSNQKQQNILEHRALTKIGHMLGHETSLNKLKKSSKVYFMTKT